VPGNDAAHLLGQLAAGGEVAARCVEPVLALSPELWIERLVES
jgi:hypothetical protein